MASLITEPIDLQRVIGACRGALDGVVRNHHNGRSVIGIDYHAYESMALKELTRIEDEATERWSDAQANIVHRIGSLGIGEASVCIAVSSPHRAEAFEACRFCIDRIKETVPVWKKELYSDGHAWIEGS